MASPNLRKPTVFNARKRFELSLSYLGKNTVKRTIGAIELGNLKRKKSATLAF